MWTERKDKGTVGKFCISCLSKINRVCNVGGGVFLGICLSVLDTKDVMDIWKSKNELKGKEKRNREPNLTTKISANHYPNPLLCLVCVLILSGRVWRERQR